MLLRHRIVFQGSLAPVLLMLHSCRLPSQHIHHLSIGTPPIKTPPVQQTSVLRVSPECRGNSATEILCAARLAWRDCSSCVGWVILRTECSIYDAATLRPVSSSRHVECAKLQERKEPCRRRNVSKILCRSASANLTLLEGLSALRRDPV